MLHTLHYLGPEKTYSHQAAQLAQSQFDPLHGAQLSPTGSAAELYHQLTSDLNCAVIVPVYNLEQGLVYDFARFFLHEALGSIRIQPDLNLYGSPASLDLVQRIYTKDTVVPQVSRWLKSLPEGIAVEATSKISTAAAATLAAQDPFGAAICGPQAGYDNQLHHLAGNLANNQQAYTEFQVLRLMAPLPSSALRGVNGSHPYRISPEQLNRLQRGEMSLMWRIDAQQHPALHRGHQKNLEALRYWLQMGNHIHILVNEGEVDPSSRLRDQINTFFQKEKRDRLTISNLTSSEPTTKRFEPWLDRFDLVNLSQNRKLRGDSMEEIEHKKLCQLDQYSSANGIELLVGGLANILSLNTLLDHPDRFKNEIKGGLFLDYVPGIDGYAKMSTYRRNHAPIL